MQVWPPAKFAASAPANNATSSPKTPKTPKTPKKNKEMKLVLLGDSRVGKTVLVQRLLADTKGREFAPPGNYKATVGMEHHKLELMVGEAEQQLFKLVVWDRDGAKTYGAIVKAYYKKAVGALLLYSVADAESFAHVDTWLQELAKNAGAECPVVLVGTQADLPRQVSQADVQELCERHEVISSALEVSGQDGTNVVAAFEALSVAAYVHLHPGEAARMAAIYKPPVPAEQEDEAEAEVEADAEAEADAGAAISIVCPDGCSAGDTIMVEHDGQEIAVTVPDGVGPGDEFKVKLRPSVESLYAQMRHTRVLWSFGCARGAVHLAIDLQKRLLAALGNDAGWAALGKKGQDASYIDCVAQREGSYPQMKKNPSTGKFYDKGAAWRKDGTWTGTWRNDHWAEYYYMGALLAHTVVVALDTAWVKSQYCQGELALFLENARHAYDAGAREQFPGSRFQVVVIYDDMPGTVCDGEGCQAPDTRHDGLVPRAVLCAECRRCAGGRREGCADAECGKGAWYHCSDEGCKHRDLCASAWEQLGAGERERYEPVESLAQASELRLAATKDMFQTTLGGMSTRYSGEQMFTRYIPGYLTGKRKDDGSFVQKEPFEKLVRWVRECSASIDAEHGERDAEADKCGYSELYARHWQGKAVGQQQTETLGGAWWWRPRSREDAPHELVAPPQSSPTGGVGGMGGMACCSAAWPQPEPRAPVGLRLLCISSLSEAGAKGLHGSMREEVSQLQRVCSREGNNGHVAREQRDVREWGGKDGVKAKLASHPCDVLFISGHGGHAVTFEAGLAKNTGGPFKYRCFY